LMINYNASDVKNIPIHPLAPRQRRR
jgi:hypothetical protein